ncbi:PREDICTED: dTDP-glucose 4,6-dehydratase-like, partial [Priapulus caudatus]|uniref:dTDP-glucose 4,6-dehydratase-like n=1 Tax=Priapulus caudatus TaxID=37621 RepID=A0ABM1F7K6_PRICU
FVEGSIADEALVEKILVDNDIDTIVNFAAESHVDRSISGPDIFIETNIVGTHNLLKAARRVWIENAASAKPEHRFHHVSTDEVYGELEDHEEAFTEDHVYAPNSPYSASKASSDHLVRAYHHTFGLNVTTTNCSNNYGPYQYPEKLIPLFLSNILRNKPLPVYGTGYEPKDTFETGIIKTIE